MGGLDELFKHEAVEVHGDNVTVITSADGIGRVKWAFEAIEVRRKDFDAQLSIEVEAGIPGYADAFPATHFSGGSVSGRDTFRRLLDGFYGKDIEWSKLLPKAYALARDAYLAAAHTVDLADTPLEWEEQWHCEQVWPADGVTILFGTGSSGKGHVSMHMAMACLCSGCFLERTARGGNVLYLDYESSERVLARRLNRHLLAETRDIWGKLHYMPGRAIPVTNQIDAIRRELGKTHSKALIVDSAVPALGDNPIDAAPVGKFFNALNALRVPVWLIAHTPKAEGEDAEYPYGSVFWHNLARMTWFVRKVDDEDSPDIQVAMYNKKANEGRRQASFGAEIRFDDPYGPITVSPYDVAQDPNLAKGLTLSRRIWNALRVPKTTPALAEELQTPPNVVRATAHRMKGVRSVVLPGEKEATWSRIPHNDGSAT